MMIGNGQPDIPLSNAAYSRSLCRGKAAWIWILSRCVGVRMGCRWEGRHCWGLGMDDGVQLWYLSRCRSWLWGTDNQSWYKIDLTWESTRLLTGCLILVRRSQSRGVALILYMHTTAKEACTGLTCGTLYPLPGGSPAFT